mgnify:CR=1 FL=1
MNDERLNALLCPQPTAIVTSLANDPNFVKCPRCWHYHSVKLNHDNLCDRCCRVMVENFPDHEQTPFILASLEKQREMFRAAEIERGKP